ncbi:MAG: hypothetical protein QW331_04080 [Candidatus Woesearchaeota archaeon]
MVSKLPVAINKRDANFLENFRTPELDEEKKRDFPGEWTYILYDPEAHALAEYLETDISQISPFYRNGNAIYNGLEILAASEKYHFLKKGINLNGINLRVAKAYAADYQTEEEYSSARNELPEIERPFILGEKEVASLFAAHGLNFSDYLYKIPPWVIKKGEKLYLVPLLPLDEFI